VANILSAIVWAPAHVFPGVVFGLLVSLAGASPEQIFVLAVAAMILSVAVVRLVRYFLKHRKVGDSGSTE
jgi:membrane protein DedA with SNARE-associated domain